MLLRTDRATRACYRTDGGQIAFGLPDSFVHARRPEDVAEVLRLAQRDHVPVTCRGGGLTTEGESVGSAGILLDIKTDRNFNHMICSIAPLISPRPRQNPHLTCSNALPGSFTTKMRCPAE